MFVQARKEMLLYAAGAGSVTLTTTLLDDYHVPINTLVSPGVCLDCDPICLTSECAADHSIGMETALMAAALSGRDDVVELLCSRGADVNVQNEVRQSQKKYQLELWCRWTSCRSRTCHGILCESPGVFRGWSFTDGAIGSSLRCNCGQRGCREYACQARRQRQHSEPGLGLLPSSPALCVRVCPGRCLGASV